MENEIYRNRLMFCYEQIDDIAKMRRAKTDMDESERWSFAARVYKHLIRCVKRHSYDGSDKEICAELEPKRSKKTEENQGEN